MVKEKPPQKVWFVVHMEGMAPVSVQYRVLAETEDEAFEIAQTRPNQIWPLGPPNIDVKQMHKKRVTIKNTLTGMINWVRNF